MNIIRGTTPTICANIQNEIDLHDVTQVWFYIAQQKKPKVDKTIDDCEFDYDNRKIIVTLTQEDTLNLKAGEAIFQLRILLADGTALANEGTDADILEVYKQGVITVEEEAQDG